MFHAKLREATVLTTVRTPEREGARKLKVPIRAPGINLYATVFPSITSSSRR